jgi:general secretion pathway protein F
MPIYTYKAKRGPQDIIEGTIEAASEKEAIEKISQNGLIPVKIETEASTGDQKMAVEPASVQPRVSARDITLFTRQLASLLKAGVPILKALRIIAEQSSSGEFSLLLKSIYTDIEAGAVLSSVLARYPAAFSPLYIAMIRAGEDSGQLPQVLLKITEYRMRQEEMLSRVRTAMAYPALMAIVGFATVIFMLAFVMPRLTNLYSGMGQALPLPTRIVIAASTAVKKWGAVLLVLSVVLAALCAKFFRSKSGRLVISQVQLSLPLVRGFMLKAELARFSRTMELLLKSGINILRALHITLPVMGNEILRGELARSYGELEQGNSFGKSLKNSRLIPLFMSNLLIVGEESGKLDDALAELAGSYERDTDEALKALGSLIEPAMILVMGIIVGFIVIAMLLPVFEMNSMIR